MNYSAFIITFNRPKIVINTISILLNQTLKPKKILVVDNDPNQTAFYVKDLFPGNNIEYLSVGYNSGPAGGAYYGLKTLFDESWEWVLWVDDDDPPVFDNQIENLFSTALNFSNPEIVGVVGATGVLYNYFNCQLKKIPDKDCIGIIKVDMIGGNQLPLVHRRVYESGILPNPEIFFGFEDLEFNLRVKQAGYMLFANGEEILRLRNVFNNQKNIYTIRKQKNIKHIWREYYSVRSIAFIHSTNKNHLIFLRYVLYIFIKCIFSFRYGFYFGIKNARYLIKGILDGYRQKLGLKILPTNKY